MSIFVLVGAYQEQDDPPTVEAALRNEAGAFADHPDYRAEWAVRDGEENITIERLLAAVDTAAVDTAPSTPHLSPGITPSIRGQRFPAEPPRNLGPI